MVGIQTATEGAARWFRGGWASMVLFQTPSSATDLVSLVQVASRPLRLGMFTLVVFPKVGDLPYNCQVKVPKYFRDATIEVWRYDGVDLDLFGVVGGG